MEKETQLLSEELGVLEDRRRVWRKTVYLELKVLSYKYQVNATVFGGQIVRFVFLVLWRGIMVGVIWIHRICVTAINNMCLLG